MSNRCVFLFVAAFLLAVPLRSYANDSAALTPCDLLNDPAKYNKQTVQVRGRVSVAFEDFTLATPDCDSQAKRRIWLAYASLGFKTSPARGIGNVL